MKNKKPFFARFLENQSIIGRDGMSKIKGGDDIKVTLKFPSDTDEPLVDLDNQADV